MTTPGPADHVEPTTNPAADQGAGAAHVPGVDADHAHDPRTAALRERVHALMPQALIELSALASIPSISALPSHADQVRASAAAVAQLLSEVGAQVQVVSIGQGAPAVIGRVPASPGRHQGQLDARRTTVLLYAHHDVQPAGDESEWATPPFTPTVRGERIFGRGVADDKAGVLAHVTALRAFDGKPPVDVIVFVEGEEESGSPSLPALLETYRDELDCDVIVLADSTNWAVGTPALTTSLRGLVIADVELATLSHGLHSGIYGGAAPDAITAMCRLLATLHHEDGSVAVAGLDSSLTSQVDYTHEQFRQDAHLLPGVDLIGKGTITSRLWYQPSITVTGFEGPSVEEAINLLTPRCRAVISVRLAPQQDAQAAAAAVEAHLRAHAPWGSQVEVTIRAAADGSVLPTADPVVDQARAAMAQAWGNEPVEAGIGGGIPFIAQFQEAFPQAVVLVTGVEDPDTRAHGTNESLHLAEFEHAALAEALLLERLGCRDAQLGS